MAVIVDGNGITVFDSHYRNTEEIFLEFGAAVLLQFEKMNMSTYQYYHFHLSSVIINVHDMAQFTAVLTI